MKRSRRSFIRAAAIAGPAVGFGAWIERERAIDIIQQRIESKGSFVPGIDPRSEGNDRMNELAEVALDHEARLKRGRL